MRNVINFYQPWPRPSREFADEMRERDRIARERFDAKFRPIEEAPRDGTEIMVSSRKAPLLLMNAWRTKWCAERERWVCWFGEEQGWVTTSGEPKYWLHEEAVRDIPPLMFRVGPALAFDLTP